MRSKYWHIGGGGKYNTGGRVEDVFGPIYTSLKH
jgi:hypothetical protein